MPVDISSPTGAVELTEFITFQDRINSQRDAWWPAVVPMVLPTLQGEGPGAVGRTFLPLVAKRNGEILARILGVVDQRYVDHWKELVGHTSMFEALPGTTEDVRLLMNEVGGWLRNQGMESARAGFGVSDFPFLIDAHDTLPPIMLRQNPGYYHALLKEAGYESEKGWTDYRIEVTPDLVERWRSFVASAERRGFTIVPLRDVPEERRIDEFNAVWNEAFASHWGVVPTSREEHAELFELLGPLGMFDLSVIAYTGDEPVGVVWVAPEGATTLAATGTNRSLRDEEKVNFLAIGVRERARGQGVNLAMSAFAYLELAQRGARYVSYTLVLDDNWPSRRTAEKLGAHICANYMVYRRYFKRPRS